MPTPLDLRTRSIFPSKSTLTNLVLPLNPHKKRLKHQIFWKVTEVNIYKNNRKISISLKHFLRNFIFCRLSYSFKHADRDFKTLFNLHLSKQNMVFKRGKLNNFRRMPFIQDDETIPDLALGPLQRILTTGSPNQFHNKTLNHFQQWIAHKYASYTAYYVYR